MEEKETGEGAVRSKRRASYPTTGFTMEISPEEREGQSVEEI